MIGRENYEREKRVDVFVSAYSFPVGMFKCEEKKMS